MTLMNVTLSHTVSPNQSSQAAVRNGTCYDNKVMFYITADEYFLAVVPFSLFQTEVLSSVPEAA